MLHQVTTIDKGDLTPYSSKEIKLEFKHFWNYLDTLIKKGKQVSFIQDRVEKINALADNVKSLCK